jgi:hypothetical protein
MVAVADIAADDAAAAVGFADYIEADAAVGTMACLPTSDVDMWKMV